MSEIKKMLKNIVNNEEEYIDEGNFNPQKFLEEVRVNLLDEGEDLEMEYIYDEVNPMD